MTNLDCSVKNCRYNENNCCCKENIQIDGSSARCSNETCCGSFVERSEEYARNSVYEPSKPTNVSCKAENCKYNEDCQCHASDIDVAGSKACCCGETECKTFCCK